MNYQQTTQVPNLLFDQYLPQLSFSELKISLYIIRQTYGWKLKNGKRKQRDRITYGQLSKKTGLSKRIISETIQSLILKQLITVTDFKGNIIHLPQQRKGKVGIYYASNLQTNADKSKKICKQKQQPMQNRVYNKTNNTKLKRQKGFLKSKKITDWERIHQILNLK